MKSFAERSPLVAGAVGIGVVTAAVLGSLNYDRLPFISDTKEYSAFFADSGGLDGGAHVEVSGLEVGKVSSVTLDGSRVLVRFKVANNIRLGDRTEAAIKTKTLLGGKMLEVLPRGDGHLSETIPLNRTTSPYQLPEALGDLSTTISGLNTQQVSDSLATLAQTFQDTPPELRDAVEGAARLAQTLNSRDEQLRNLLANARKATGVLAHRSDQVVSLIANGNALLEQLQAQSSALDKISAHISAVSRQISGLIADNRDQLGPALDKLNGVLAIVDNRKDRVQKSIKLLNAYAMSLGESVASAPYFKAYVANLIPGQFLQPFIEAAFSDLGLDPNVLLPSQLSDPQTGQTATPALPVPYPRTGQGGEPRLTLPDAITGHPGDPRYPYREPPAAPPPGGAPPGPPAPTPGSPPAPPQPSPVIVYAPGESPASGEPADQPTGPLPEQTGQ